VCSQQAKHAFLLTNSAVPSGPVGKHALCTSGAHIAIGETIKQGGKVYSCVNQNQFKTQLEQRSQ
jgi:hypothetical protein